MANCPFKHGFVIRIPALCMLAASNVFPVFEFQSYRTNNFVHVFSNAKVMFAIATGKEFICLAISHLILQSLLIGQVGKLSAQPVQYETALHTGNLLHTVCQASMPKWNQCTTKISGVDRKLYDYKLTSRDEILTPISNSADSMGSALLRGICCRVENWHIHNMR